MIKKFLFLFFCFIILSCEEEEQVISHLPFQELSINHTGVDFSNTLVDTEDFNILEYLYFYNGAGIAVEDFNNDGLEDLYLGSNQGTDQIYYNKGNFRFENVTHLFNKSDLKGWTTGVNVIDANKDGWMDIYVCRLGKYKMYEDTNKLFINQKGKAFIESAADYGLDFSGFSTQAAFIDYDRDGDLDCYLLNHSIKDPSQFSKSDIRFTRDSITGDRFYENIGSNYIDVTEATKIYSSSIGFGLGITVADFNNDNWPDLYIGNDFHEQDYLYLNNGDKTFEETITQSTGHTSNFSMGVAAADLNNDALLDIVSLDMKPFDDNIYKKSGGWESSQIYNYKRSFGYHHQSPRNALQLCEDIHKGIPYYTEQAGLLKTAATDWSWSPLIADFDNDGDQDIYITNGITKRPNDMDFINFEFDPSTKNKIDQLGSIPSGAIENVYLENQGVKGFKKHFSHLKTVSNAGVIADLNLDGLPDLVISNLNKPLTILKNVTKNKNHYFQFELTDSKGNPKSIGGKVVLHTSNGKQVRHFQTTDGFLSHSSSRIHFGLGTANVDSMTIHSLTHKIYTRKRVPIDSIFKLDNVDTGDKFSPSKPIIQSKCIIENLNYKHNYSKVDWQGSNKWALFNSNSQASKLKLIEDKIIIQDQAGNALSSINGANEIVTIKKKNNLPSSILTTIGDEKINLIESNDFDDNGTLDYFIHTDKNSGIYIEKNKTYQFISLPRYEDIKVASWMNIRGTSNKELILAGLWMPIYIVEIKEDKLEISEIPHSNGLWTALYIDDLNEDGKQDILAGNFGLNHDLSASETAPLKNYSNDFDRNGSVETLVTYFVNGREVPYPNQESFVSQLPAAKKKFLKSVDYVKASVSDLLPTKTYEQASQKRIELLSSSYFLQNENTWEQHSLPAALQVAPIYAIDKVDNGLYCFGGNLFEVDPNLGRQDAGLVSIFEFSNGAWRKSEASQSFCPIKGEVRDILYHDKKLYLSMRGDSLKLVYLNQ